MKRWYENTKRGSPIWADICLRRVGSFCNNNKTTPAKLVKMSDKQRFNILLDYVASEEKVGHAGSYISSTLKAVKSWLAFNGKEVRRKIKIRGASDTPSLRNQKAPNQEELKRIFLSGDKKTRTACVLMAHAGVRPEVIGNYYGKDGLCVGDIPEMEIRGKEVSFTQMPATITIRSELSKTRNQYFTFLSEEGCGYLKDYLEERMLDGEEMTKDSPLVTPKRRMKPFIRSVNIGDIIRNAIRRAGFSCRPYELRTFFDTQLMIAESKGLVIRDYRTFWMGHMGDIENRYTTHRKNLPAEVIENMREAYQKSQVHLQTIKVVGEEDLERKFQKTILKAVGFKSEEIDDLHPSDMTDDEFSELVKKKLIDTTLNENRQRVVSVSSVEQHLEQGWEFVTELSNHKAVIRLPN